MKWIKINEAEWNRITHPHLFISTCFSYCLFFPFFLFLPHMPGHSCRAPWILQPMLSQWRASSLTASSSRMMRDARCPQLLQLLYRSKAPKMQARVYFCENNARLQALSIQCTTIDDSASNPTVKHRESKINSSCFLTDLICRLSKRFSVGDSTG